jgi:DNA-directed RNA polymerase alpha subunit
LLNLTNFGQKSLDELVTKLDELGLSLPTSSDLDSGDMADA